MKKISAVLIGSTLAFLVAIHVSAQNSGANPLRAIWLALQQLQQVVANIQLIPGPQGPVGPAGPQGATSQELHLYDALGQDLGILVNANYDAASFVVYSEPAGVLMGVSQNQNGGIALSPIATIYFPQSNCTGQPYTNVAGYPHKAFFGGTNRIYTYMPATPAINMQPLSEFSSASGCANGSSGTWPFYALQEVTLPLVFPLLGPLHIAH